MHIVNRRSMMTGNQSRDRSAVGKADSAVEIDGDVREEYWTAIRKKPEQKNQSHT